jgi:hypothetical protein
MIAGILRVGGEEVANYRRVVHFQGLLWDQLKHMQPLAPASPQPLILLQRVHTVGQNLETQQDREKRGKSVLQTDLEPIRSNSPQKG